MVKASIRFPTSWNGFGPARSESGRTVLNYVATMAIADRALSTWPTNSIEP